METQPPLIELTVLRGNDIPTLVPLQELLLPYLPILTAFWMAIWWTTLVVVLAIGWRTWKHDHASRN